MNRERRSDVSLQTYRQTSRAFYLTVALTVNIGQLLTGFTSRVLSYIVDTNWMESSLPYCKIKYYIKNILLNYKEHADKRISQESRANHGIIQRIVTEILVTD
jgi:hypothetical protein